MAHEQLDIFHFLKDELFTQGELNSYLARFHAKMAFGTLPLKEFKIDLLRAETSEEIRAALDKYLSKHENVIEVARAKHANIY